MKPYKAVAMQLSCHAINRISDPAAAKESMHRNLERVHHSLTATKRFMGPSLRLAVLPEYFLSGFPMQESVSEWQDKACISTEDELFSKIKKIAVDQDLYLAGNLYELDPQFPEIYFQLCFIINPEGALILRYRRLNSMFSITPYDVMEKYISVYGKDSFFPVADTPIGRLACVASEEILYPEITRCLAMEGAEIILHPTSEVGAVHRTQKQIARQARAIENEVYVISANSAGILKTPFPAQSTDGHSAIVKYDGTVMAEAGYGESMVANDWIHLDALRHYRSQPGMKNILSRQRNALFAEMYASHQMYPPNTWHPDFQKSDFIKIQQQVIDRYFTQKET